jgi:peptidoglycan/LPS O-acetylase OafA/YrhL
MATGPSPLRNISVGEAPDSTPGLASDNCASSKLHLDRRYYRPELDVLRFFAFVSVFLFHGLPGVEIANHAGWSRLAASGFGSFKEAGSFGVCLFFVLSSFLITQLLMRERLNTGTVHVKAFYIRRILRIWPLYFAFLFVGYLFGHVVPEWRLEVSRLAAFMALVGNWYVAAFGVSPSPIAPLWSISIEEQFYLTWPWLAKAAGRRGVLVTSVLLLPMSCLAIYFIARSGRGASQVIWFSSVVQFEFFALGALTALLLKDRVPHWSSGLRLCFLILSATLWIAAEGFFHLRESVLDSGPISYLIGYQFVGLGCVLLLVGFLGMRPEWVPRQLVYLGKISYGLYVFHYLCLDAASWAFARLFSPAHGFLAVAVQSLSSMSLALLWTTMLAMFSYRFLEQPFLRLKERFTFIRSRSV